MLNNKTEKTDIASTRIDWHTAFYEALQAELSDYINDLEFIKEQQLTTEPLRIDILVIKKNRDAVIKKQIADSFLGWNIIEYKSPEDRFSIEGFHKTCAYAHLYMALHKKTVGDITLTIAGNRHPRGLMRYIQGHGMAANEKSPGVYSIQGGMFPIQFIETKRLPEDEFMWLKNLNNNIDAGGLSKIISMAAGEKIHKVRAYLYALLMANPDSIKEMEVMDMSRTTLAQVLDELGYIKQWEARGEARGKAIGIQSTLHIINGLKKNIPVVQLSEETDFSIEDIEKIKSEL